MSLIWIFWLRTPWRYCRLKIHRACWTLYDDTVVYSVRADRVLRRKIRWVSIWARSRTHGVVPYLKLKTRTMYHAIDKTQYLVINIYMVDTETTSQSLNQASTSAYSGRFSSFFGCLSLLICFFEYLLRYSYVTNWNRTSITLFVRNMTPCDKVRRTSTDLYGRARRWYFYDELSVASIPTVQHLSI